MAEFLRYPKKNIGPQDDYLKIQVLDYKAPGLNTTGGFALRTTEQALEQAGSIKTSPLSIILPMPSNIQDNNSADWTSGTMNPLQGTIGSAVQTAISGGNLATGGLAALQQAGGNLMSAINTKEGQSAVQAATSFAAIQAITGQGDINQITSRFSGNVFNQNVELLFQGVTLRPAYGFNFDIVPRSKSEADEVKKIIWNLKRYMTPRKGTPEQSGGGLFIKAPYVFQLMYMSGGKVHPFLHRFKPCALTQMTMNYNGSGQYATYSDATPVHMQLGLQFQELSPIYSEDYESAEFGKGTLGVGY